MRAEELTYQDIITIENLFQAWYEFRKGKRKKVDVQLFERNLEDNLFELQKNLQNKTYRHGIYQEFYVNDPKRRHIHKAGVCDRVVHHLLYKYLYELFDKTFIYDSYSCRIDKGTHRGVKRLKYFARKVSKNYTKPCWALKFDVKKFFASIEHKILLHLLARKVEDPNIIWLIKEVVDSFHSDKGAGYGIPLGNLTSQVFANVYMNELDQFIKDQLKVKYYLRYADDFVILSRNKMLLESCVIPIEEFLKANLNLELHPSKIIFRKLSWGIDFLGYITLPYYRLPRTNTKKRVFKKLKQKIDSPNFSQSTLSYLGYLSHANSYALIQDLKNKIWFWLNENSI